MQEAGKNLSGKKFEKKTEKEKEKKSIKNVG